MENNRSKEKSPQYVDIYNKILKNIQDGLYQDEMKLPNEIKLAEQMGVSRMTLRQALLLLREDGVIEARKGVGNFLRNQDANQSAGLEEVGNVLQKCGISNVDRITSFSRLDPSALYVENMFERKVPILLGTNLFYYFEENCCAHCFSMIPADVDFINEINLTNEAQIRQLICNGIYEYVKVVKLEIKVVARADDFEYEKLISETGTYTLIFERMLDYDGNVICLNKYYIPTENTNMKLNSFKK